MNNINEWFVTAKEKVVKKTESAKEYVINHKGQVVAYGIAAASLGTSCVLGYKLIDSKKVIVELNKTIANQKNRIGILEELCIVKDEFFDYAISEGTRCGSTWCARQLAYKKSLC